MSHAKRIRKLRTARRRLRRDQVYWARRRRLESEHRATMAAWRQHWIDKVAKPTLERLQAGTEPVWVGPYPPVPLGPQRRLQPETKTFAEFIDGVLARIEAAT